MVTNEPYGYLHASFLLVNYAKARTALLSLSSLTTSHLFSFFPLSLFFLKLFFPLSRQGLRSEIDWSLSPRKRIMERTTKSLKFTSVRLLSTRRFHHHQRGDRDHHGGAHHHHHSLRFRCILNHH